MSGRLARRFAALRAQNRAGLVTYVMGYDPDPETSLAILRALPAAGADVIELGFPFSDPMADGVSIQKAGERALKAGASLRKILDLLARFRAEDFDTPVILMGYANPVEQMGADAFAAAAAGAGADGAILVDLPPEEDAEVRAALAREGLSLIRLATPTTDAARLPAVLEGVSGFVYYVAVAGVTGAKSAAAEGIHAAVRRLKAATSLPIAVGFGVREPRAAAEIAEVADAVVVGSALVEVIAGSPPAEAPAAAARQVLALSDAIRAAKRRTESIAP